MLKAIVFPMLHPVIPDLRLVGDQKKQTFGHDGIRMKTTAR